MCPQSPNKHRVLQFRTNLSYCLHARLFCILLLFLLRESAVLWCLRLCVRISICLSLSDAREGGGGTERRVTILRPFAVEMEEWRRKWWFGAVSPPPFPLMDSTAAVAPETRRRLRSQHKTPNNSNSNVYMYAPRDSPPRGVGGSPLARAHQRVSDTFG